MLHKLNMPTFRKNSTRYHKTHFYRDKLPYIQAYIFRLNNCTLLFDGLAFISNYHTVNNID